MGWRHLKCFHRTSVDAEEGYVGEKDTPADRIWDPVWRQKNLHVFFWDSLWPYKKQTCGQSVASGLLNNSFQTCKENDLVKTLIFGSVGPKLVLSLWIFLPIHSFITKPIVTLKRTWKEAWNSGGTALSWDAQVDVETVRCSGVVLQELSLFLPSRWQRAACAKFTSLMTESWSCWFRYVTLLIYFTLYLWCFMFKKNNSSSLNWAPAYYLKLYSPSFCPVNC